MRFLLVVILLIVVRSSQAVSVFFPLEHLPSAESVAAFSNQPNDDYRVVKLLQRADLLLFLREGKVTSDPSFKEDFSFSCSGVFFTTDGRAFDWALLSPTILQVGDSDHRSCWISLSGRDIKLNDPVPELVPPKAGDVVGFGNARGDDTSYSMPLEKAAILRFLAQGTTGIPREKWSELKEKGLVTLPPSLYEHIREMRSESFQGLRQNPLLASLKIKGVFSTQQGTVFYWELWDDHLLHLKTAESPECLIRLP